MIRRAGDPFPALVTHTDTRESSWGLMDGSMLVMQDGSSLSRNIQVAGPPIMLKYLQWVADINNLQETLYSEPQGGQERQEVEPKHRMWTPPVNLALVRSSS